MNIIRLYSGERRALTFVNMGAKSYLHITSHSIAMTRLLPERGYDPHKHRINKNEFSIRIVIRSLQYLRLPVFNLELIAFVRFCLVLSWETPGNRWLISVFRLFLLIKVF